MNYQLDALIIIYS